MKIINEAVDEVPQEKELRPELKTLVTFSQKNEPVEPAAIRAWAEKRMIYIELTDGRIIGFPANRFKLLAEASEAKLQEVALRLNGYALRWESLDEDITVPGSRCGSFSIALSR